MVSKAMVATIDLGIINPEGLMLPNGKFAFGVSQVAEIFQFPNKHASRDIKAMMDKGFQFPKCTSELNPKAVNILMMEDFALCTLKLAFKGDNLAQALSQAFIEETLERRFARAFGVKIDEDEFNEKLKFRIKRLLARHDWTDVLMNRYVDLNGVKPLPRHYREWTVTVNKKLFGQPHFRCDRENMTTEQQQTIYDFERMAKRRAEQFPTIQPDELIIRALDTF